MVSSKNVKVSQKRCLGTSIESFTGSSQSEQIIDWNTQGLISFSKSPDCVIILFAERVIKNSARSCVA